MSNILEYKGYHTKVEYDSQDHILYGKIEGINDYVNFESDNPDDVENEFHSAVDDYLSFCEEVGKAPEKEYKGSFNVRISPELHRKLALVAYKKGDSLNKCVEEALSAYVSADSKATESSDGITLSVPSPEKYESTKASVPPQVFVLYNSQTHRKVVES